MAIKHILLASCLIAAQACTAGFDNGPAPKANGTDEVSERNAVYARIDTALAAGDFAGLSAMEADFRASRARTPSGLWKLAVFHAGVQHRLAAGLDRAHACGFPSQVTLRQWAAVMPDNPAPVVTEAALLVEQAWCVRGRGLAYHVPASDWPTVHRLAGQARDVLESHRDKASVDPEYYAVMANILLLQNADRKEFHDMIEEASDREPAYHRTYFNAAWYYLPQWGGKPGDLELFARYAASRSRSSEGDGVYARIDWSLEECDCGADGRGVDWGRMKASMRNVYDQYPTAFNGEYFAQTACRQGDGEEGRRYIRAISLDATSDADLVARFAACDAQARS